MFHNGWCLHLKNMSNPGQMKDLCIGRMDCELLLLLQVVTHSFFPRSDCRVSVVRTYVRPSVQDTSLSSSVKIKRQNQESKSSVKIKHQNQASKYCFAAILNKAF